jgi:hypothetical protein
MVALFKHIPNNINEALFVGSYVTCCCSDNVKLEIVDVNEVIEDITRMISEATGVPPENIYAVPVQGDAPSPNVDSGDYHVITGKIGKFND